MIQKAITFTTMHAWDNCHGYEFGLMLLGQWFLKCWRKYTEKDIAESETEKSKR